MAHNESQDITGVLCQGTGMYMQVLEGERSKVCQLFYRIVADPRHHKVELIGIEDIEQRSFEHWSMALVHLNANDPMVKMNHPEFNPYAATMKSATLLLRELVETGWPIVALNA